MFPDMFSGFLAAGIVKRAIEARCMSVDVVDIRGFATDRHRTVDDRPYGGGCGMVMKPEPLAMAIGEAKARNPEAQTILLSPQGKPFDQRLAQELCHEKGLILVCGRYEGVDERVSQLLVDMELSIGDFILTGGELASMIVMDAIARLLPGSLGNDRSALEDSFADGGLDHPQYTRPRCFEGECVPDVLLEGDHGAIRQWRQRTSLIQTLFKRPDLLYGRQLSAQEITILKKLRQDVETILESHASIS